MSVRDLVGGVIGFAYESHDEEGGLLQYDAGCWCIACIVLGMTDDE